MCIISDHTGAKFEQTPLDHKYLHNKQTEEALKLFLLWLYTSDKNLHRKYDCLIALIAGLIILIRH